MLDDIKKTLWATADKQPVWRENYFINDAGGSQSIRGKGGVVWHTQGSGKSITMTCFAARVMQEPAMENPTIVVITDRNDMPWTGRSATASGPSCG